MEKKERKKMRPELSASVATLGGKEPADAQCTSSDGANITPPPPLKF